MFGHVIFRDGGQKIFVNVDKRVYDIEGRRVPFDKETSVCNLVEHGAMVEYSGIRRLDTGVVKEGKPGQLVSGKNRIRMTSTIEGKAYSIGNKKLKDINGNLSTYVARYDFDYLILPTILNFLSLVVSTIPFITSTEKYTSTPREFLAHLKKLPDVRACMNHAVVNYISKCDVPNIEVAIDEYDTAWIIGQDGVQYGINNGRIERRAAKFIEYGNRLPDISEEQHFALAQFENFLTCKKNKTPIPEHASPTLDMLAAMYDARVTSADV